MYNYIIYQITSTYNTGKFQSTIFYIGAGHAYYFFVLLIEDLWLLWKFCNKENNILPQFADIIANNVTREVSHSYVYE